jgi:hypothetical protein
LSLAEFDWLDYGSIKGMESDTNARSFLEAIPNRMALGLLRRDEHLIGNLVNESRRAWTKMGQLEASQETVLPETLAKILLTGSCVVIVGDAFLQGDQLWAGEVFEHHLVKAFNAIKRGDTESAFEEALRFSFPSIHVLTGSEEKNTRIGKIKVVSSRLHELRLPNVPEARKLKALVRFLEDVNECAYSLLVEGHSKAKSYLSEISKSNTIQVPSVSQFASCQPVSEEGYVFDGALEFMNETIKSFPNIVIGRINRCAGALNQFSIADFKVLPCDITLRYSAQTREKSGLSEPPDNRLCAGRAASRLCCSKHEMLALLHPETRTLNEMLRAGYSYNAIAVTDGEKCMFRLHDGSDNTIFVAHAV